MTSRRDMIGGAFAAPLIAGAAAASAGVDRARLLADLEHYASAGPKHSGGAADSAIGVWMEAALREMGFATQRLPFETPYFEPQAAWIEVGGRRIPVLAQAPVVTTPQAGVRARLVASECGDALGGAIALVALPYGRWSTLTAAPIRTRVEDAFARGARACVLITTGPSGEAIALNAPFEADERLIAIVAPRDAGPLVDAARRGDGACLDISGIVGRRQAFNLVGTLERGSGLPWIAISTPRSGWTSCAAERGPGVAIWMALMRWAPRALTRHNLFLLSSTGHEYENLGMRHVLATVAPAPASTTFWLHLGAAIAARDWHEAPGRLLALPSADAQRYLLVDRGLLAAAARAFAGQPGLENPYPLDVGAAGELAELVEAGYGRAAGAFGAHRLHHTMRDSFEAVDPAAAERAAEAFMALLAAAIQS